MGSSMEVTIELFHDTIFYFKGQHGFKYFVPIFIYKKTVIDVQSTVKLFASSLCLNELISISDRIQ